MRKEKKFKYSIDELFYYIKKMDIVMLNKALDKLVYYPNENQEKLIEKLEIVFHKFKSLGDTKLIQHVGHCGSNTCHKKMVFVIGFVGNKSKQYITLVFEENDREIVDIHQCGSLWLFYEIKGLKNQIFLYEDDHNIKCFQPDIDFIIQAKQCKDAYLELMQFHGSIINIDTYLQWRNKHAYLNEEISSVFDNFYSHSKFYSLFYSINLLCNYYENEELFKDAIAELNFIKQTNKQEVEAWLLKYEDLMNSLTNFSRYMLKSKKDNYIDVEGIKIYLGDLKPVEEFVVNYKKIYKDYLYVNYIKEEDFLFKNDDRRLFVISEILK